MSITGFQVKQSADGKEFNNVVLPEDSYQVEIEKIELREGTKYLSTEMEMKLLFYLKLTDPPSPEFKDKLLFYNTSTSFFNGEKPGKGGKKISPSKLYVLIKTIYKTYKPDVNVSAMEPEDITDDVINELEGKQFVAIVKINENGNNTIREILSAKVAVPTAQKKEDDFINGLDADMENALT